MAFASQLKKPFLLINFKAYNEAIGISATKLAQFAKSISSMRNVSIAVAPTYVDLRECAKTAALVFAQHIAPIDAGARTGAVTAESAREAGCIGTIINHSERRLEFREIEKCVSRARLNGLLTICCADSLETARNIAQLNPDYIAYEPPELIGTNRSVSRTKPDVVKSVVQSIGLISSRIGVVCGAGIADSADVRAALQLGAVGMIVSSAIVKSMRPEGVIDELVKGFLPKT